MPRPRCFREPAIIGVRVEKELKEAFYAKCRELGLSPSEVLRAFIEGFCRGDVKVESRNVSVNVAASLVKVEQKAEVKALTLADYAMLVELRSALKRLDWMLKRRERKDIVAKQYQRVMELAKRVKAEDLELLNWFTRTIESARRYLYSN